jgi:AAA+ superfamily predicted ATPase
MSAEFMEQVDLLVRARYPLIQVLSWEEHRAVQLLNEVASRQQKPLFDWSVTDGLRRVSPGRDGVAPGPKRERDALAVLNEILQNQAAAIYVLKDFHPYFDTPGVIRQLRDLGAALRQSRKTIVFLSPALKIPTELEKEIVVVDLPLPTVGELKQLLDSRIARPDTTRQFRINLSNAERDQLVRAALGLTLQEAERAFARAIVRDAVLDGDDIAAVLEEKVQIVRKSGLLEYCPVEAGLDTVGGMDLLKDWLRKRVRAFSQEARDYGLPDPRGVLLLGVQGCGKSLVAKSVAASWRMPLLRMDMSHIFQGFIGSSEENMRKALKVAESLAPVVLWIDEIEKAFAGHEGSAVTDGGTTARVIGLLLTWLQERKAPVFVAATANDISGLPPELMRKGRLDEIFFVDLPRSRERAEIFQIHLRKRRRDPAAFDLHVMVGASEGFSGAEIEQALVSAMHDSFFDDREVNTQDIVQALGNTVPISRTMRENVDTIRRWAADRARPVSSFQLRHRNGAAEAQADG